MNNNPLTHFDLYGLTAVGPPVHGGGCGTASAAIRYERASGKQVADKWHSIKGQDAINRLENWLRNNPSASHGDRAAAKMY